MVQFITHYNERYSYLDSVRIALEGGCRWIQLRMKDSSPEEILLIAEKALAMCREYHATFIIDDHVELAKQIKADGVHQSGADYIGCGPFRFTTTKKNLSPVLGLEGYRHITLQMKEAGIHLPIVAIGGITPKDIPALMETGITGIALSGSILQAEHPIEEMKEIINTIEIWKN